LRLANPRQRQPAVLGTKITMSPKQLRQLMVVIVAVLLAIGAVAVYSSSAMVSEMTYGDTWHFIRTHLAAIFIGLVAALGCLMLPFARIRNVAAWLLLLSIGLLVLVLAFGQQVGGAQRWFRLGPISIQPSELAKLALIVYLSDYLARKHTVIRDMWRGLLPPLVVSGLAAGLVLIQPDLGTALVMVCVCLLMLAVANADARHLLVLVAVGMIGLVVLIAAAEYRRRRMLAFLDPWQDPQGIGYQIIQSYCALARGGWVGVGIGASLQKLFYLPSAHTDFVFAIIAEELGLFGSAAVLTLFTLFVACGLRLAMLTDDLFGKYLVCGIVGMLGFEAMINVGVVTGMLPTKGLPLPFISYGGTSMVMNLIACALVFQASRYGERRTAHPISQ